MAWASWEGIFQCYGFYGCPRSLDVCPQLLVLICLAWMGAGGRRRIQYPVNWNSESSFPSLLGMGGRARGRVWECYRENIGLDGLYFGRVAIAEEIWDAVRLWRECEENEALQRSYGHCGLSLTLTPAPGLILLPSSQLLLGAGMQAGQLKTEARVE